MGPVFHDEWKTYSHELWMLVTHLRESKLNYKNLPETVYIPKLTPGYIPDWRDLYFRRAEDFYCGSFYHFSDQWLVTINSLPGDDEVRHEAYKAVHSGIDLYQNQGKIMPENARAFRKKGRFYTEERPHKYHNFVHNKLGLERKDYP